MSMSSPSHRRAFADAQSADYTQNPFASSHSLDTNPFDDPTTPAPPTARSEATRLEELRQRERDLERREEELNKKAEHIRTHGKNNWPPCPSPIALTFVGLPACRSFPPHFPFNSGRNPRGLTASHHTTLSTMARPAGDPYHQLRRLHFHPPQRCNHRWWKRCRCKYRVCPILLRASPISDLSSQLHARHQHHLLLIVVPVSFILLLYQTCP